MTMKNPPHPGLNVKDALDELNVSVSDAADALGMPRKQLNEVVDGRSNITAGIAIRLEKGLGSTADFWLRLQMKYDLAQAQQQAASIRVRSLLPA